MDTHEILARRASRRRDRLARVRGPVEINAAPITDDTNPPPAGIGAAPIKITDGDRPRRGFLRRWIAGGR